MVRNLKEASLPQNPKWISIEASDGNPQRWPKNTDSTPDNMGNVNFMKPIEVDHGLAIKWRNIVGQALAEMLHYPGIDERNYVLKDWPSGYKFYDHHKGPSNGNIRHDLYLVGSDNVARFRSPAEFIPHAYWLITDAKQNRDNCQCKYCARRPQRGISDAFGLNQRRGSSPLVAHYATLPRLEKKRKPRFAHEARVFAVVRHTPKPYKPPEGPKHFALPERENDLRALLHEKSISERRWAREGELVWVKLDKPIRIGVDSNGRDAEIQFWPGLINDMFLRPQVSPKDSEGEYNEEQVPWTVSQIMIFKIRLLMVNTVVLYGSDHILPYQSNAPDTELLGLIQSVIYDFGEEERGDAFSSGSQGEPESLESIQWKQFQQFNPYLNSDALKLESEQEEYRYTAAGAYAVAIQIASRLTMFWTPSDEYKHKALFPDEKSSNQESSHDASSAGKELRAQISGVQKPQIEQKRFQGLWWGPERIWVGDLVRLKIARYQLSPDGTEDVKKPSKSGVGAHDLNEDFVMQDTDEPVLCVDKDITMDTTMDNISSRFVPKTNPQSFKNEGGATLRSVFMRIDGIFITEVRHKEGSKYECRVCGMLYELEDHDWYGPDEYADLPDKSLNDISSQFPDPTSESASSVFFEPNPDLLSGFASRVIPAETSSMTTSTKDSSNTVTTSTSTITKIICNREENTFVPPKAHEGNTETSLSAPPFYSDSRYNYPTPPAPNRLRFRPILREGREAVLPLTMLAGRYYPGLLGNSLLSPRVRGALQSMHRDESDALWALEGLVSGALNSVGATLFKPRRSMMVREAEKMGWNELVAYWREQVRFEREHTRGNMVDQGLIEDTVPITIESD